MSSGSKTSELWSKQNAGMEGSIIPDKQNAGNREDSGGPAILETKQRWDRIPVDRPHFAATMDPLRTQTSP